MVHTVDGKVIRFGLGNSGVAVSPVWRLWIQGDETYLAVRTMIGISKISLHRNRHWRMTTGASATPLAGPRRLSERFTAGPRVVFPGIPPTDPLLQQQSEDLRKRQAFLFDPPAAGQWRDFVVVFGHAAVGESPSHVLPSDSQLIGPLSLRSERRVWLGTFVLQMSASEIEYVRTERGKVRVFFRGELSAFRSTMALLAQDTAAGDTMLVALELGRTNFTPDVTQH